MIDAGKILLLSDNTDIKKRVEQFCLHSDIGSCTIISSEHDADAAEADLVLITQDKIPLLISSAFKFRHHPIIFLQENPEYILDHSMQKNIVHEVIDMKKITPAGFFRAMVNAVEKFQIAHALHEQKMVLRELTQLNMQDTHETETQERDTQEISHTTTLNTKLLLEENRKLIDIIRKQNSALKNLARIDALTKIGNRLNFEETLESAIANADRHKHILGLLFLDLDKFKNVNDAYGHQTGDLLLQNVAQRMQSVLRKDDFIARLGGDEFAIILREIKSPHTAGVVADKIIQEINKTYHLSNGVEVTTDASIGIACYPSLGGNTAEELMKNADIAMYQAKKSRTLKYAFVNPDAQSTFIKKAKLEDELRLAIQRNELTMVYQPIYAIPKKKLAGFEALIRWENKSLGKISPAEFIPIAENSRLIHEISKWVLEAVTKQIALWNKTHPFTYKISVNVSPLQLVEGNFVEMVNRVIAENKISITCLEFEITEVVAIQESKIANSAIRELCKLGASHTIDNFGTGYSSMKRLQSFPISTIKIDQSFVQGLGTHHADDKIVASIISLAQKMGLKVVAAGVETEEQLQLLIAEKCEYAQGFLFSKPLSAEQATKLILEAND